MEWRVESAREVQLGPSGTVTGRKVRPATTASFSPVQHNLRIRPDVFRSRGAEPNPARHRSRDSEGFSRLDTSFHLLPGEGGQPHLKLLTAARDSRHNRADRHLSHSGDFLVTH